MARADATANYCSHCGSRLDRDANYCGQCGTRCRETTPAGDRSREDAATTDPDTAGTASETKDKDKDKDIVAFRRRVQDRVAVGWDIEHDDGDSVVLVDREFGGLWAHLALFLFTGGVGNLVYAWYEYSYDADRVVLRAGESDAEAIGDERAASGTGVGTDGIAYWNHRGRTMDADSVAFSLVGVLLLVVGVAIIVNDPLGPFALLFGVLSLAGAAWAFPPARERLKNRHPVTTFGRARTVTESIVENPNAPCVACASPADGGVERTYREEYAVAGVPLVTTETGTNVYCHDCASGTLTDVGVAPLSVPEGSADRHETGDSRDIETEKH